MPCLPIPGAGKALSWGAFNVEKLSDSLVYGKEGDFMAVLAKIKAGMPASGPAAESTIYTTLASLLLQAILNYLPRESSLLTQINLEKLANYNTHHGFRDACYYLETVAGKIFPQPSGDTYRHRQLYRP